ncbi:hypothetical protein [Corynebacterium heidelbergense]|uniref:hypothetical protein n=1 Tax=Corynebacterium heidelbergense TaxID=2055947 RepID=UPI0034E02033
MEELVEDIPGSRRVNLDKAAAREAAEADPDGFADQFPDGLLAIDEIQRVPRLLLSIKASLEVNRSPRPLYLHGVPQSRFPEGGGGEPGG